MQSLQYLLSVLLVVAFILTPYKIHSQPRSAVEFDIRQELKERLNLFEQATRHIRQNNFEALRRMDEDVLEAISFFGTWQQTRLSVARGIRVRTASDEEINRLAGDFIKASTKAESARSGLSFGWPLFLENQQNTNQFAERINKFIEVHRLLMENADALFSNRSDVNLPTMAGLYGPEQIELNGNGGPACGTEFVIENIGSSRWSEVNLRIETIDETAAGGIWTEPDQIPTLSAGKAVKFDLCASGDYDGRDLVRLLIESGAMSKVQTLRIIN